MRAKPTIAVLVAALAAGIVCACLPAVAQVTPVAPVVDPAKAVQTQPGNPAAGDPAAATSETVTAAAAMPPAAGIKPADEKSTDEVATTPRWPGDEVLPSLSEAGNNPYLNQQESSGEAFVPPQVKESIEQRSRQAGVELREVLGSEVFDQRVNITTPPDTDIAEVVRLLAERSQLNFVVAEGVVKGRVTLNLRDVPLGVALQSLLASQDLSLVREGANVLRIVPRQSIQSGTIEMRTIYIKLNWVIADTIATTLKDFGGSGSGGAAGNIKAHKESNTVIITDTPTNVAMLRDIVAQLDVPQKQVMIEARLVELIIDKARALGSNTRIETRDGSNNSPVTGQLSQNSASVSNQVVIGADGKPSVVPVATLAKPVDAVISNLLVGSGAPSLSFGTVISIFGKSYDIASTLDGLEKENVINVLANPRVITLNNEPAFIDITRRIPYIEAQQGVTQGATAATVKFEETGVKLSVIPTITNNGFLRMKIEPEQKILGGEFFNPTTGSNVPIVDKRNALTNVIIKDEDTVVIGGLRQITSAESVSEYPWIGKTPFIGNFFKNTSKGHVKNDLMVFVTPHVVKAPVLTTAENYKYSRVDAHWDLPDYFFDDTVDARESRHRYELDQTSRNYYPDAMKLPAPAPEGEAQGTK